MENRILGNTGLSVSPITIGAWQLGGPLVLNRQPGGHPDPGKDNVIRMIRELGELGVNAIDTAEQYSDGESERRVGEAIRGRRDAWVISTKFGYRVGPNQTREDNSSPPTILPSIEGSLKRLGVECIDILLYHCAPRVDDLDAAREVLDKAKADGKVRFCGISCNDVALMDSIHERGLLEVVQYHANLLEPDVECRSFLYECDVGVQVRGVMAQGRLSGKYIKKPPEFRGDDIRYHRAEADEFLRYAPLGELVPDGMTMAQAAIRWTLDQPGNHTICLGAKNIADYRAAIAAADMPPLPAAVSAALEQCAATLA